MLANSLLRHYGVSPTPKNLTRLRTDARRELARRELIAFTQWTYPQYRAEAAHGLIAATLERVLRGEINRLMVFAPPQHGKSELVSRRFPPFWLAHRPDDPIILTSYGASLAESHSSDARATVESDLFYELFRGIETRRDSRAKQQWRIARRRGGLLAVGVGGPVVGHGAYLGIIDDPFENWAGAQSLTTRNYVWEWWRGTFRTRIWERGAIILVCTRWHEDDLAGRLLSDQAVAWTVLRLPATAETQAERDENARLLGQPLGIADPLGRAPGEALCPQRFSAAALSDIKRDVGGLVWASEYQGVPRPAEGNLFKRAWFAGRLVDAVPVDAQRARYWDKAATAQGGDFTAGVLVARHAGLTYIEDVVRGQWSAFERERVMQQTAETDGRGVTVYVEQEGGSGGRESAEATIRNLAGYTVRADHPSGDKFVRAQPFSAQCEAGQVYLKRGAWNAAYLDELTAFPNASHDDQVDATSGAFNKLAAAPGWAEYARRQTA